MAVRWISNIKMKEKFEDENYQMVYKTSLAGDDKNHVNNWQIIERVILSVVLKVVNKRGTFFWLRRKTGR